MNLLKPSRLPLYAALAATAWGLHSWRALSHAHLGPRLAVARTLLGPGTALDPTRQRSWKGYFLVAGGTVRLAPEPKPGQASALYQAGEGLLLPAWADAHAYLELEGRLPEDARPGLPLRSLKLQRDAGVTALADLNTGLEAAQKARAAAAPGLRLALAGPLFTSVGGWQPEGLTPWDRHQVAVAEASDVEAAWAEHLRFGYGVAFASVEHEGREGLAIPLPILRRLSELAHGSGLKFFVHAYSSAKALQAMQAGPDALVGPLLDEEALEPLAKALRARRTRYVPSLSVVLNSLDLDSARAAVRAAQRLGAIDAETAGLSAGSAKLQARVRQWSRRGLEKERVLALPRRLAEAGVALALGTGSGLPLVFHGAGLASELGHLRHGGFSTEEVLAMAQESRALLGGSRLSGPGQPADVQWVSRAAWADGAWDGRPELSFAAGCRLDHER